MNQSGAGPTALSRNNRIDYRHQPSRLLPGKVWPNTLSHIPPSKILPLPRERYPTYYPLCCDRFVSQVQMWSKDALGRQFLDILSVTKYQHWLTLTR